MYRVINPPLRVIENLACYKFDSLVSTKLNLNGYYQISGKYDISNSFGCLNITNDSINTPAVFFDDGTIVWGFSESESSVNEYFQKTISDLGQGEIPGFYNWFFWGHYEIQNDSIIAQIINHPSAQQSWRPFLLYFKIHSKEKIRLLGAKILDPKYERLIISENAYIGNFIPTDTVPPPIPWVKKRKWYWCDENEWEQYKRSRINKKK